MWRKRSFKGEGLKKMTKILVADDQASVRMLLQEVFKQSGFTVETAVDGQQAIDKAAEFLPDIILMDMQMPRIDGMEASQAILSANPHQVIALMTAHEDLEEQILALGIRQCIKKPFDVMGIVEQVRRLLDK
jgi:CheY-like chemotaxis protein